ncbi:MAG: hypothetical protein EOM90_04765 [Alphaproteobacteria bacterium]|nr:hypothetical protein [Alphaproteobacteria bacterium]
MGNISRHTGKNLGGLNQVSWIFREDVSFFTFNDLNLYCSVIPKIGGSWSSIYGTPETVQLESEQQDSPAGMKYIYKLKMLVPKDRAPVESELFRMTARPLIMKLTDKNGTIRIFGTMESPMKLTSKLMKPAAMETFNGYELLFTGEFTKPAGFLLPANGIIPDEDDQD